MARTMGQPRPEETESSPESNKQLVNVLRSLHRLNADVLTDEDSKGWLTLIAGLTISHTTHICYLVELGEGWTVQHYSGKKIFASPDGRYKFTQFGMERLILSTSSVSKE